MAKFPFKLVVDFAKGCDELRATAPAAPLSLCSALRINGKLAKPLVEAFNEEADAIAKRFADRDEKGQPIESSPGAYKVSDYQGAMAALKALDETEVEFTPHPINPAEFPATMPPRAYDAIMNMIEANQPAETMKEDAS